MWLWNPSRRRWAVVIVAAALYVLSCATPTLDLTSTANPHQHMIDWDWGYAQLLLGWLSVLSGLFAWVANPLFAAALLFCAIRRPRISVICGVLSLLASADLLRFNNVQVPADEGGAGTLVLHGLLIGALLWYAALLVVSLGSLVLWLDGGADSPKTGE